MFLKNYTDSLIYFHALIGEGLKHCYMTYTVYKKSIKENKLRLSCAKLMLSLDKLNTNTINVIGQVPDYQIPYVALLK